MDMTEAFADYQNKMNKLANALEAEAYYLQKIADSCNECAEECQAVADNLTTCKDNLVQVKASMMPESVEQIDWI